MRAEDQDALDVSGPARAGDEGDEAREIFPAIVPQDGVGSGEVRHDLGARGEHDVVRRQDGERPPARAQRGDEHAAGLRDERGAFGDADVGLLQFPGGVSVIGAQRREAERGDRHVGQAAGVGGDALPVVFPREFAKARGEFGAVGQQVKLGFEVLRISGEKLKPRLQALPHGRKPLAELGGFMMRKGRAAAFAGMAGVAVLLSMMAGDRREDTQRLADATQDLFFSTHGFSDVSAGWEDSEDCNGCKGRAGWLVCRGFRFLQ